MFWTNIYALSPQIEALLKRQDVTLHELMDQEEIVSECKSQNKMLVDYLSRPDIMQELVTLTTKEPSTDVDERKRYKYPNVACELLTCNVPSLNEKLAGDANLLAKLYSFIDTDEPLNPLLASFFSKTIGVLLTRKSDQNWYSYQFMCLHVLEFLKSRESCVDRLLQHLETSAIMDLVLKLVTMVEGNDMRKNVLNWLDSQQLVQRLIKLLSPSSEPAKHANAALLLCDMIKSARHLRLTCTERTDPDPILNTLESEETVSSLLETILSGEPVESSIVGGIQVLLVLLSYETNNGNEEEMQGNGSGEDTNDEENRIKIQNATLPYLELLQKLLLNPPPKPPVKTTVGLLTSPLGNTRLHVAKLLVAILYTENFVIFWTLAQLGTFQILLDLFFKYSWNNFLHTEVERCLASVINGEWEKHSEKIYHHIFVQCKLTNRLLEAWEKNESKQNTEMGVRQGYMGHLIKIIKNIVDQCAKNPVLAAYLKTNPSPECAEQWEDLVNNDFAKVDEIHQLLLGGNPQPYMSGSNEPNDDYNSYGEDAFIQQTYATYQSQEMAPGFVEPCGFRDDGFDDPDEVLHNSIVQLTTAPFTLNEEDFDKGEDMFNKICQQKQKVCLYETGGGVEWGDEVELTSQTVIDKRDWTSQRQQHSNSSDADDSPRDINMEVDPSDPWGAAQPLSSNAVLPRVNPWDVDPAQSSNSTGWANFDNFESALTLTEVPKREDAPPCEENPVTTASGAVETVATTSTTEAAILPKEIPSSAAVEATEKLEENHASAKTDEDAPKAPENDQQKTEAISQVATVEQQSQKVQVVEAGQIAAAAKATQEEKSAEAAEVVEQQVPTIEPSKEDSSTSEQVDASK